MKIIENLMKTLYRKVHHTKLLRRQHCISTQRFNSCTAYDINLMVKNVPLKNYVNKIIQEYNSCNNGNEKQVKLYPIVNIVNERKTLVDNIVNVEELLKEKDIEIKKLAEMELTEFTNKLKEIDDELLESLLPVYEEDSINSIVLEVQAGVGGQEAMLFAKEIFNMYCNFAEYKGWDVQIADYLTTESGGIRFGSALIEGDLAFRFLKFEAGVHRVQRIPLTEKGGRIHTSTVSVVTLPQPRDIDIQLQQKDLKIETKRSTGAGGQHVNTTDSAVRILHIPTGIAVECQTDRSQIKNRKFALARLKAILYQKELEDQSAQSEATRRSQVRSNNRNEKIRTYNFNQDRVSDHRLQGVHFHNLKEFIHGGADLEELINTLDYDSRLNTLVDIVNKET